METLVIGGTGMVGSEVVRQLRALGQPVRVLTRSADKARSLPEDVRGVVGDLTRPDELGPVFEGVQRVFMANPVSLSELFEALAALDRAREVGVQHFVYMTVHHVADAPHLPHFASKIPVEQALRRSGLPYTLLQPSNFFQNDLMMKDVILQHGVYPQPLGMRGVSRVDVRDIAEAAAIALTRPGHAGKTYAVVGPEPLTGPDCAEAWSRQLGQPVRYAGDDLERWEQQMRQLLPDWMVFDFKRMYRYFQQEGLVASAAELAQLEALLGHRPRRFEDFVAQTASAWVPGRAATPAGPEREAPGSALR